VSRLVCACGTPIPSARAGSDYCSTECENRENERIASEAQRRLAEDTSHEIFAQWMQTWRERVDREAVAAAIGLNPATISRLSKPDSYDDLRVRVHFIDGTDTDYELTGDQFRVAVRYTNDAYTKHIYGTR